MTVIGIWNMDNLFYQLEPSESHATCHTTAKFEEGWINQLWLQYLIGSCWSRKSVLKRIKVVMFGIYAICFYFYFFFNGFSASNHCSTLIFSCKREKQRRLSCYTHLKSKPPFDKTECYSYLVDGETQLLFAITS